MTRNIRLAAEPLEDRRTPSFSPAASYPVGTNPQAVATADFDNDGNLDIATADRDSGTVSVRLGDGQGGFGAANQFATGANPRAMAVGDFDNDGNLDIATIGFDSMSRMSALLGKGDGTFRAPVNTFIYYDAMAVAAGDFNGDGNSDLVYGFADGMNWDNPAVEVLLSDGGGGFADRAYYELNGNWSPVGLAVGDLDDDGKPDVVTANDYDGTVSVLLGNGDGTLSYSGGASTFATGPSPRAVAVGDFTGDGIPDVVTAGQGVDVLPGLGDGRFGPAIHHPANGNRHTAVAAGDFNGDGRLDAVTSDADTGTISELLGNGDGTLTYAGAYATGSLPAAVAVGDVNGDGRPDVAAANAGSNTVSVLLNDGTWTPPPPAPPGPPSLRVRNATVTEGNAGTSAASFIVTLSAPSTQTITVAYATADGTASAGSDYQSASGNLTFAPGQTSATITVLVNGDRLAEPNETFVVTLSSPTNATVADGQGVGTITDDEPRVSVTDVTKAEGRRNQKTHFTFTVTLSAPYDQPVTISFQTVNGTAATGDNDYIAQSGTLTFLPGETTKTITVEVKGDSKREANEEFYLDLTGVADNVFFTKRRAVGTILNDD